MEVMYILHAVALAAIGMSMVGSLYIVIATIVKGKYTTIGERFPMYVAVLDFLWSVIHSIDHIYMMVAAGANPPPQMCSAIGAILSLFMLAQVMLLNLIAVSMFLSVYMGWNLSYGSYDWILGVLTFGVPVGFVVIGLSVGAFGADLYWCFINVNVQSGQIYWIITFISACACIGLPAVCYYMIFRKLAMSKSSFSSGGAPSSNGTGDQSSNNAKGAVSGGASMGNQIEKRNRKIVEKLLEYELVLIATFSSLIVYGISIVFFKQEPIGLVFWVVLSINSAGWFNWIVFIIQNRRSNKARGNDTEFQSRSNNNVSGRSLNNAVRQEEVGNSEKDVRESAKDARAKNKNGEW
ncbi:hypothetical protein HDU67_008558 [Dinochytrium kinnereticum]|nr:hypothetical protein HDU67_008558 [Dinochytrium kinnereticum]